MATTREIELTVNGVTHRVAVEPRLLLVHFLRDNLALTGTHIGCETAQCGACTVLLDGQSVKSCNLLAVQADGAEVQTIEGLAGDGPLHPLQESFRAKHGLQCGFCTPGMIMFAVSFLREHPQPTQAEIREAMHGNLCRCTGYQNIVLAIQHAAEHMEQAAE